MSDITCIVPTHARPDLLAEALSSIAAQTAADRIAEVLVVDDIDDEPTRAAVDAARERGLPVRHVPNPGRGASSSRNLGAAEALGTLLAFLDDDDLWDAEYLESAGSILDCSPVEMVVTGLDVLELDGTRSPFRAMPVNATAADAAARNPGFTGSNLVIRAEAFLTLDGFDETLAVSNDKDFFVRFLLRGLRYDVVSRGLVIHRRHDGPQLTAADERRARGLEQFMRKHSDVLTPPGRRFLWKTIHAIRRRTAPSAPARLRHTIAYVAHLTPRDIASKWSRRDGRFSEVR